MDAALRGIVLKKLFELSTMSSLYLRGDLVLVVCGLAEPDFDRIIQQLLEAGLVEDEFQYSYIFDKDMNALKITQLGVDVVYRIKEAPIPIEFEN